MIEYITLFGMAIEDMVIPMLIGAGLSVVVYFFGMVYDSYGRSPREEILINAIYHAFIALGLLVLWLTLFFYGQQGFMLLDILFWTLIFVVHNGLKKVSQLWPQQETTDAR